ncbi:MAG: peroxidase, partial [Planctomycetaceae bacterium]|nr:peroxidase [Planctomycetaceae bacterium]
MPQRSQQRRRLNNNLPQAVEVCEPRTLLTTFAPLMPEIAAIDGSGNNGSHPEWGSVDIELLRLAEADYGDGESTPAGANRPSAREVSNEIASADGSTPNARHLTDLLWVWGQFIDHDIDITEGANPAEPFNIPVPTGDEYFDPNSEGDKVIGMGRSTYHLDDEGVRQQINQITAFLDGSVIYGSDEARAMELRSLSGGRLKVTSDATFGDLLPYNENGFANAGGDDNPDLFLAGDVRANENVALTAMQTLWVREHNRIADEISKEHPELSDEAIYQEARAIVRAELQVITYNEYLPALLGGNAISPYRGYKPDVNPGITNEFSTAAYRFGHSLLPSTLLRVDANGTENPLPLQQAFFRPDHIENSGIDSILRGVSMNVAQELDNQVVDDVRNFLFGPPGAGGFDLASLNIQRGRDHG